MNKLEMKNLFDLKRYLRDKNSVANIIGKSATKAMVINSSWDSDNIKDFFKIFEDELNVSIGIESSENIIHAIKDGVFGFRFLQLCKHDYMATHKTYLKNLAEKMGVHHLLIRYKDSYKPLSKQIDSIQYHVPDKTEIKYTEYYVEVLDEFRVWDSSNLNNVSVNETLVVNLVGKLFINSILYNKIYLDFTDIWDHDVSMAELICNAYNSISNEFWKIASQYLNTSNIVDCVEYYVAHHKTSLVKNYNKMFHNETEEMDSIYKLINYYDYEYVPSYSKNFLNAIKQISSSVLVVKYFDELHKFYKKLDLRTIKKIDNGIYHKDKKMELDIDNSSYKNIKPVASKVTKSSVKPNVEYKVYKAIHHFNLKNWYKKWCRRHEYTLKL